MKKFEMSLDYRKVTNDIINNLNYPVTYKTVDGKYEMYNNEFIKNFNFKIDKKIPHKTFLNNFSLENIKIIKEFDIKIIRTLKFNFFKLKLKDRNVFCVNYPYFLNKELRGIITFWYSEEDFKYFKDKINC